MYCMQQYIDDNRNHEIQDGFFDINSLFWSKILSPDNVKKLLYIAGYRLKSDTSVKVRAVLQKPEKYFETYISALKALDNPVSEEVLFIRR